MADREARQAAIKKAAELVRNDRTGFLTRAVADVCPTCGGTGRRWSSQGLGYVEQDCPSCRALNEGGPDE